MADLSAEAVVAAEERCVQAVTDGMKLQFALLKFGLKYSAKSKQYSRLRRAISKAKAEKRVKQLKTAEKKQK